MAYDRNNVFAKILRGEIPSIKVYEDEHALAFMDVNPHERGHTLVIPKADAESLLDLPAASAGPFLLATQKVAKAVKAALKAPGLMIAQLNGAAAGQTVFHVHFHIIPRMGADHMPIKRAIDEGMHGKQADPEELETIAKLIRAEL